MQSFSRKYMNVYNIHKLIYEQNEENCFCMKINVFRQRKAKEMEVSGRWYFEC